MINLRSLRRQETCSAFTIKATSFPWLMQGLLRSMLLPGQSAPRIQLLTVVMCLILGKICIALVPQFYAEIVAVFIHHRLGKVDFTIPYALIIGYGVIMAAAGVFNGMRDMLFVTLRADTLRRLSVAAFGHLIHLPVQFHLSRNTGSVIRTIERGKIAIDTVLKMSIFEVAPTVIQIGLIIALLFWSSDWIFAVIAAAGVGLHIAFTVLVSQWRLAVMRRSNDLGASMAAGVADGLLNCETVKCFVNEAYEIDELNKRHLASRATAIHAQIKLSFLSIGQQVIISATVVAVLLIAAGEMANHQLPVDKFVLIMAYVIQIYQALTTVGYNYVTWHQSLIDIESLIELEKENAETLHQSPLPYSGSHPAEQSQRASGPSVELRDVTFRYPTGRDVLKEVSLKLEPGRTVALVGPTGSGKSTIGRLLLRFFEVDEGAIYINGMDIRNYELNELRGMIGVVQQNTLLFNRSIGENIGYGRLAATEAEIAIAARTAQLHDLVEALPEGYQTAVGERGLKLSGGEGQRVAIARMILKNPSLLILDEATSALDTETEKRISSELDVLSQNRSTIVIAHQLSTVVNADEIIVIENGSISQRGTHQTLLNVPGLYRRMWKAQEPTHRRSSFQHIGESHRAA